MMCTFNGSLALGTTNKRHSGRGGPCAPLAAIRSLSSTSTADGEALEARRNIVIHLHDRQADGFAPLVARFNVINRLVLNEGK